MNLRQRISSSRKTPFLGVKIGYVVENRRFILFFFQKSSWRLCNAYSETLRLYRSDIFCFSLYLWIPI